MNSNVTLQVWFFLLVSLTVSCTFESATFQQREDNLIGGLSFGMSREDFYAHCMSQQKLGNMRDGLGNHVQQELPVQYIDSFSRIEYFPRFDENSKIVALPGRVYSLSWSPWSQHLSPDSLLPKVVEYFEDELTGTPFELVIDAPIETYVKTDHNRRIVVRPSFEQYVNFEFEDLTQATEEVRTGQDLLTTKETVSPIFQVKKNAE